MEGHTINNIHPQRHSGIDKQKGDLCLIKRTGRKASF